jgi:hypothetical protein
VVRPTIGAQGRERQQFETTSIFELRDKVAHEQARRVIPRTEIQQRTRGRVGTGGGTRSQATSIGTELPDILSLQSHPQSLTLWASGIADSPSDDRRPSSAQRSLRGLRMCAGRVVFNLLQPIRLSLDKPRSLHLAVVTCAARFWVGGSFSSAHTSLGDQP